MNCAKHPEATAAAYCRTCGKALCEACKRDVRGVIYCEDCLATRVAGTMPPAGAGTATAVPVAPGSGPHPAVAGVLSGFFPFGVGQVYNGQYARGLAHMAIFIALVWALDHGGPFDVVFGLAMAAFYFYQIIDAVRSARAIQMGIAPPDPFGFDNLFGGRATVHYRPVANVVVPPPAGAAGVVPAAGQYPAVPGESAEAKRTAPVGAIILIGLGVLFLIGNLGFFHGYWLHRLWPLVLIVPGLWLFANRWQSLAAGNRCGLMAPAILLTLGIMFMLHSWDVAPFPRTFPILLIVIGLVLVFQRTGARPAEPPPMAPSATSSSGTPQLPEPVQREHER